MKAILFIYAILIMDSQAAADIKHLRVVFDENPSNSAKIIFTTTGNSNSSYIYFDENMQNGRFEKYQGKAQVSQLTKYRGSREYANSVELTKLKANTNYYFIISLDDVTTKEYYFRTAPGKGASFKLLFGGDSRSDRDKRQHMNKLLRNVFEEHDDIYALVHGGDYVANGRSYRQWEKWLSDYRLTTRSDGRLLPIVPTRGNHETSTQMYNAIFSTPGGSGNYFLTSFGDLALLTLNTEINHSGTQRNWLEANLNEASKNYLFLAANYHRPAFPAVKTPGKALTAWVPLFDKYGLDIAFESDGHALKRTLPIKNGEHHERGTIYVGEGGLGVPLRSPVHGEKWYFQTPGYVDAVHHIQLLEVKPSGLNYTVVDDQNRIYDSLQIHSKNRNRNIHHLTEAKYLKNLGTKTCIGFQKGERSPAFHQVCEKKYEQAIELISGDNDQFLLRNKDMRCLAKSFFRGFYFDRCYSKNVQSFTLQNPQSDINGFKLTQNSQKKCLEFEQSGQIISGARRFHIKMKGCSSKDSQIFSVF